jgi:hypothetical protein
MRGRVLGQNQPEKDLPAGKRHPSAGLFVKRPILEAGFQCLFYEMEFSSQGRVPHGIRGPEPRGLGFRIGAQGSGGGALEKDRGSDARSVVDAELLNGKKNALNLHILPKPSFQKISKWLLKKKY